ncbi:hypothetical protein CITSP_05172 [Citrobacter sp. T1.2D-1]|nr:hypothetical protein CITSP_05172 [Citrobacter sp. T1.2D-1]
MTRTPEQMISAHNLAVTQGDLPAVLQDYRDDAVLLTPQGVFTGLADIGAFYSGAMKMLPEMQLTATSIVGKADAMMLTWTGSSPAGTISDGVDTFIIADDLIRVQTTSFTVEPAAAGQA